MLRRRRGRDADQPEQAGLAGEAAEESGEYAAAGPWDVNDDVPQADRIDFGCLHVPVADGCEVQVSMADDQPAWVTVVRGDSGLQLQAFAAPKTSGLWDEVRHEIAEEIVKSGGECREEEGPFGTELTARVRTEEPGQRTQTQPVRFLGVDGPRWFLRGVISGPAARRPELARPFEEVFADVVVIRGDHPAPPRDLLEIRLPDEARQALEEQMAAQQEPPDPFERGPEITETR